MQVKFLHVRARMVADLTNNSINTDMAKSAASLTALMNCELFAATPDTRPRSVARTTQPAHVSTESVARLYTRTQMYLG